LTEQEKNYISVEEPLLYLEAIIVYYLKVLVKAGLSESGNLNFVPIGKQLSLQ
jgi:hypothetical protein